MEMNPVGAVVADDNVNLFIQSMGEKWTEVKAEQPKRRFWKKIRWGVVTKFLLHVLDAAVSYVNVFDVKGADKKATVMHIFGIIFDDIILEVLPFWLRPFAKKIRKYVLGYLVSCVIDWMIEKYKNGLWGKQPVEIQPVDIKTE